MRPSKLLVVLLSTCVLCLLTAAASAAWEIVPEEPAHRVFNEVWAYLMQGEERELTGTEPITDLCYFGASLTREGRVTEVISRPVITLRDGLRPRIDLVVADLSNSALMHFSLDPEYGVRPVLIDDICRVSDAFDGVQIDFEMVSRDDARYFFDFLRELRARLPAGKQLSVALPARTEPVTDAYDYVRIAPIVDRMVIMAYDEHWSTSAPGPVASLPWCAKVADYVTSVVDRDKIVMGLPLYGRAWQDKRLAKALRFRNVQDLVAATNSTPSYASELGAWFEYSESVNVKVYYDDNRTILEKLDLYRGRGVRAVSFWRVGQGPAELWSSIEHGIQDAAATPAAGADGGAAQSVSESAPDPARPVTQ
jgi:spore germination protein